MLRPYQISMGRSSGVYRSVDIAGLKSRYIITKDGIVYSDARFTRVNPRFSAIHYRLIGGNRITRYRNSKNELVVRLQQESGERKLWRIYDLILATWDKLAADRWQEDDDWHLAQMEDKYAPKWRNR